MRSTAVVIGVSYAVLVVVVTVLAVWFAASTRSRRQVDPEHAAEREKLWMGVVALVLGVLLIGTLFFTPYGRTAAEDGEDAQTVRVVGRQFGWQIAPTRVQAGRPVEFRAEATDVNHGFGVYDEDDRLVTQTQVMPGRVQRLVHTFDEPGTYRVLCLEFCGVLHHEMIGQLEVAP